MKLPGRLGFKGEPVWWPLPLLMVSGLLVGCAIKYLPGTEGITGRRVQVWRWSAHPDRAPRYRLAGLATLALGVVLGPEAPLIAIGGGLGVLAVQLAKKDAAADLHHRHRHRRKLRRHQHALRLTASRRLPAHGSVGTRRALLGLVLVPGLLSAGIGYLIFLGLNTWTGLGTFSWPSRTSRHSRPPMSPSSDGRWSSASGRHFSGLGV